MEDADESVLMLEPVTYKEWLPVQCNAIRMSRRGIFITHYYILLRLQCNANQVSCAHNLRPKIASALLYAFLTADIASDFHSLIAKRRSASDVVAPATAAFL